MTETIAPAPLETQAVINIPPDNKIYSLGRRSGTFHVYNTGNPPGGNTNYEVTITNINHFVRNLAPGGTDSFNAGNAPGGNATYIQNHGRSRLQVLYVGAAQDSASNDGSAMRRLLYSTALPRVFAEPMGDAGNQAMQTLQNQWYNVITTALNLDQSSFQLLQTTQPLSSTSKGLWEIFNSIPPNSLTQSYSLSELNNLYDDYKGVVMTILPPNGYQWINTMGDSLGAWNAYKKTLKPGSNILVEFKNWAQLNLDPGQANAAYTQFVQLQNGIVGSAVQNVIDPKYIDPSNGPMFSKTILDLRMAITQGVGKTFSFDSNTASSDISHTWASGNVSGLYDFFSAGAGGSYDAVSSKAASSHVTVSGSFGKVVSFAAAPGGWFSSAAMNLAYKTSDNTVWPTGQQPDWNATFGANGNMLRFATELVVVDGIDITITSSASYSTDEQKQISANASIGFWPFFSANASGGSSSKVTFDDSGTMTVTTSVPQGNPAVLGVNVTPIARAFGNS